MRRYSEPGCGTPSSPATPHPCVPQRNKGAVKPWTAFGLIAAGATNRDAAAALFVSVRTVETHVAAIYRKLGVRTRAELARRLAAQ